VADRLETFAVNSQISAVYLNEGQDLANVMRPATSTALASMQGGIEGRVYQATADLLTGTLIVIDSGAISVVVAGALTTGTLDWSDREVRGSFRAMSGATQYPGGANDYQFDAGTLYNFWGYLGLGAQNGAGGQVSPMNPPVPAAGTSWAILITANVFLYYDAADGKLKLYNATGSTLRTPTLWIEASGQTGARP
jgi:hypothetical protein